jgi:tyrosine decarboxylase/aspartate 1-decarboxylase
LTLEQDSIRLLQDALAKLDHGFDQLPDFQPSTDYAAIGLVLDQVAERLHDNYPYPHPLYAGQMMKPPHPVARLAYSLALWLNPNNHALDGGRASSVMEKEAVAEIAAMFGWSTHLGHLCSGGTLANLEALWVAGRLHPGKKTLASGLAHYTHARLSEVLGNAFCEVAVDARGKMDVEALHRQLDQGDIGTVVVTLGTTGIGSLDPLPAILALRRQYAFRLHVDAAYGGYFTLIDTLDDSSRAIFDAIRDADSIVVDPHKHGLQPYGCGCILFRDPAVGAMYQHDSPYTYFTSAELHLGEISLECSRPGASAVALWATQQLLPLTRGGDFSKDLAKSLQAAQQLYQRLKNDQRYLTILEPELDIVVWGMRAQLASEISQGNRRLFDRAAKAGLHLALLELPAALLSAHWPGVNFDVDHVTCLRSCLMKPEHLDWCAAIWRILDDLGGPH